MPNINITDSRKRDAVVKAESVRIFEPVRYVGPKGGRAYSCKVLKSTVDHDFETLKENFGDAEALGQALVDSDPEIDFERFGTFLWNVSRVYINQEEEIVFRVEQNELVRDPWGKLKERRPRKRAEANVDADIPLTWTGRMIPKAEAVRRFVFSTKLQIVHINGLTYDFLHGMASELADANALMLLGGGKSGKQPLIFRRGSVAYRGFLEGRVDGDRYALLLHLSNAELKRPAGKRSSDMTQDNAILEEQSQEKTKQEKVVKAAESTTKSKPKAKKKTPAKRKTRRKPGKKKTVSAAKDSAKPTKKKKTGSTSKARKKSRAKKKSRGSSK